MANALPYMRLYPGDELQAPASYCSLAAQGLWLRLRMIMHSCEPYGYLIPGSKAMAKGNGTIAGQSQDNTETDAMLASAVLAGQTVDIGRTRPSDALIARMCGVTNEELARLIAELDEAGATRYTVNHIMYCQELIMQASEREQWRSNKRRQRELPFNGDQDVQRMSRRSPANVPALSTPSSSSLSYSKDRSAHNGKRPEAERRQDANQRAVDQVTGKRDR